MLEYKAILTDFAEFKKIPFELEEYVTNELGEGLEDETEVITNCEILSEFKGKPIQISLKGSVPEPLFRDLGPAADLEMILNLGEVIARDQVEDRIEQVKSEYCEYFDLQGLGTIEVVVWEVDNGRQFAGLSLKAERVALGQDHIEVLDLYLLRLYLAAERVLPNLFRVVEGWDVPGRYAYMSYVHEARKSVDRLFLVSGKTYLESDLEPLDWNQPGVDSKVPESIPAGFVQSEFTGKSLWQHSELLEVDAIRENMFNVIAQKLSVDGNFYSDDEQMLWVVNHVLVGAGSIFMSINTLLSLGSRGYFRVPEHVQPFNL